MDRTQPEFDFEAPTNKKLEMISEIGMLPFENMTPGRVLGVTELLARLVVLMRRTGQPSIAVHRSTIANGIKGRRRVSERTVSRWSADGELLGLVDRVCVSQQFGGQAFNVYRIHWSKIKSLVNPSGLTRVDTGLTRVDTGLTRVDSMSPPRVDSMSPPIEAFKANTVTVTETAAAVCPSPSTVADLEIYNSDDWPELAELRSVTIEPKQHPAIRGGALFDVLKLSHLKDAVRMHQWFQAQLAVSSPILPPQGDFLVLCVASALHAAKTPQRAEYTPVGRFASIIKNRYFSQALGRVPTAIESLTKFNAI